MNAIYIIAITMGCAGVGGFIGLSMGDGADDFGFGAAMSGVCGVVVGGAVGVVTGTVLFA